MAETDFAAKPEVGNGIGSMGPAVVLVQTMLKASGHFKGEIDGRFDVGTKEALLLFRRERGLPEEGSVDHATWKELFASAEKLSYSFENVLERELIDICLSRSMRLEAEPKQPEGKSFIERAHDSRLTGLALSGGGIRSATFNLGVLQALAESKILSKIDYLSTVSGGGYIGSWLAAWIKRQKSLKQVEGALSAGTAGIEGSEKPSAAQTGQNVESQAIKFLRSYSNYITPKAGLFSSDTWSVLSTYLRNLTLNLTIIVTAFVALLLTPRLLIWGAYHYIDLGTLTWILTVTGALLLVSLGFIELNLESLVRSSKVRWRLLDYRQQDWVRTTIAWPAVFSALCLSYLLWRYPEILLESKWLWAVGGAATYSALWLLGCGAGTMLKSAASAIRKSSHDRADHPGASISDAEPDASPLDGRPDRVSSMNALIIFTALFIGTAGGLLFASLGYLLNLGINSDSTIRHLSQLMSLGPPSVIMLFSLIVTLHIGLMGRRYPVKMQEWWSRLGGFLMIVAVAWAGWFGIAIYGPLVVQSEWAGSWVKSALTSGWLVATIGGVLAGKSPLTSGPGSKRELELLAKIAPYLFVVGLLLLLSTAVSFALDSLLNYVMQNGLFQGLPMDSNTESLKKVDAITRSFYLMMWWPHPFMFLVVFSLCTAVTLLFAWRVDINQFSMHLLYRNRLVRCYLGASNFERDPQPFTGFDPRDDLALYDLALTRLHGSNYQGPYIIINTALNLVAGRQLAWQERKAASFVFTPQFCGYELPTEGSTKQEENGNAEQLSKRSYLSTAAYASADGGISLGTALAISGAAASPNMGYHSSPPLAFLMTIFNIRLGWWLGNTRIHEKAVSGRPGRLRNLLTNSLRKILPSAFIPPWIRSGPNFGFFCLLSELFGFTTSRSKFVYLSDGGHFDNLGIYELVRRRCHCIIACDASQDGSFAFDDLANTIRKCYADFGIEIEIDVRGIQPEKDRNTGVSHYAVGTIHYEKIDHGASPGKLIYLKPSFTGNEPADLISYHARESEFPHQSTVDQWFGESQFESYRKLGYHVAIETFRVPTVAAELGL